MMFIVGEIGVNWDGDFTLVEKMMKDAKKVGCDAVKFQAFTSEMVKNHPEKNRLMRSAISKENVEEISNLAKRTGIEWFCTPMYPEAVQILDPFVKRFKIREFDGRPLLRNEETVLLRNILKTNKEIIVSSTISPKKSQFSKLSNIKWMYCVPKYPCELSDLDFTHLDEFDGYSNHSTHFIAPLTASILGAEIIELHVTVDKTKNFIDNNVSFDFQEMSELINLIKLSMQIIR